jgi:hypothetical protein
MYHSTQNYELPNLNESELRFDQYATRNSINHDFNLGDTSREKIERPLLGIVIVVHTFIIIFAILSNALVIYLALFNFKLRNVRNAFMVNLTFANLLLVTICTPSFIFSIIFKNWVLGNFWCKFIHSVQIVIILVAAFSIMMIAIDRWMFVVFARSRQLNKRDTSIIILVIWLVAILLSVPTFLHRHSIQFYNDSLVDKLKELKKNIQNLKYNLIPENTIVNNNSSENYDLNSHSKNFNLTQSSFVEMSFQKQENFDEMMSNFMLNKDSFYCVENWTDSTPKRIYILILFFLEFALPCLAMLVTYIWIIRFLKEQDEKMNHYELLHKRLIQKEKRHQKNCKLLSSLCLTFIICCLPLSVFNIKAEFDMSRYITHEKFEEKEIYSPLILLTTLEELNTLITPLLYGWMNHNFRNELNEKFKLIKQKYGKIETTDKQMDQNSSNNMNNHLKKASISSNIKCQIKLLEVN